MAIKKLQKERAVQLRRQGKTYNEILEEVPVAKSTLSLWLRSVGLSKSQKQKITAKRKTAQKLGAAKRRAQRVASTEQIFTDAKKEIGGVSKRERLLIGAALYWAEGSKERSKKTGQGVEFGNTDASMMKFFVDWLVECMEVKKSEMVFRLDIHEDHAARVSEVIEYWRRALEFKTLSVSYVYYKRHNPKTSRRKTGQDYYGTLRVRVRSSSALQRKISGIIYGITGATWRIV